MINTERIRTSLGIHVMNSLDLANSGAVAIT